MDIWQLIERDYANINHLIREIPNALNGPGVVRNRERLLSDLLDELHTYAVAMGYSLLNPLYFHDEAKNLVDQINQEHRIFIGKLKELLVYGKNNPQGWLNSFEDATYLLDQSLHRHRNELLPMARRLLSPQEISAAAPMFIRAKSQALRAGGRGKQASAGSSEFFLVAAVSMAVMGVALLAWRFGLLRGTRDLDHHGSVERSSNDKRLQID